MLSGALVEKAVAGNDALRNKWVHVETAVYIASAYRFFRDIPPISGSVFRANAPSWLFAALR